MSQEKKVINTKNAPAPIGIYEQAIRCGNVVYLSGQIPLNPETGKLELDSLEAQILQALKNLQAVCVAAGGGLNDIVKLNIYLTDLSHFALVNQIMENYFVKPYPARSVVQVSALPRGVDFEIDAVMVL